MVHGLEILKGLNARADHKAASKAKLPVGELRNQNRPWTKGELSSLRGTKEYPVYLKFARKKFKKSSEAASIITYDGPCH